MSPQKSIAHYRVTAKLGEGGMGEVWRAMDTRLNREVAIKVLPDAFANDPDRMARFQREARVLASLNHPNIGAIYGVEERAIVMELAEGTTPVGPMPLDLAMPLIQQLIDALEYAHEKGIVHRDLKPANIRVTPEGRVKVLDFGLAKAMSGEAARAGDPAASPTLTMSVTMAGVILGTAAYMSPEQARGEEVDKRADIWAFGVVVYELLTGRKLFEGSTVSDTLAAVLTKDPDFAVAPPQVRRMLELCLTRDARRRLRDISGARVALEHPAAAERAAGVGIYRWIAITAVAAAITAGAVLWRTTRDGWGTRPLVRLTADLGRGSALGAGTSGFISPDGSRVVFSVVTGDGSHLATRLLSEAKTTILPGPASPYYPFYSPDGQWLAFFADTRLYKVSFGGGTAIPLCEATIGRGGAWGPDGTIVVSADGIGLVRIPDSGGDPKALLRPGADEANRWPQFLPGNQAILYTSANLNRGSFEDANLMVLSLMTGKTKTVYRGGYYGRYLPTGHLIFVHEGALFAVPFDPEKLETKGAPVALLDDVAGNAAWGSGNLDFSRTGTLVYLSGEYESSRPFDRIDSAGRTEAFGNVAGGLPHLSPDGNRLAVVIKDDLAVYDARSGALTRITFAPADSNLFPVWTPDGKYIVFSKNQKGIWWTRADGSGQPQLLLSAPGNPQPDSISPDGKWVAYTKGGGGTNRDIWMLPFDLSDPEHPRSGTPELVVATPGADVDPAFSPDGRFLAYTSQEGDHYAVFVRALSGGGLWQIAGAGGRFPVWVAKRKQLLFIGSDGHLMVTDYGVQGPTFSAGSSRPWVEKRIRRTGNWRNYDVFPDGTRVLGSLLANEENSLHMTFLLNFFDEVRRRVE